jgi:hypothetical protein
MVIWLSLVYRIRNIAEHALVARNQADPLRQARTTHAGWLERTKPALRQAWPPPSHPRKKWRCPFHLDPNPKYKSKSWQPWSCLSAQGVAHLDGVPSGPGRLTSRLSALCDRGDGFQVGNGYSRTTLGK